jgi:uncharacterized repeat protein (TIGR03803 family)
LVVALASVFLATHSICAADRAEGRESYVLSHLGGIAPPGTFTTLYSFRGTPDGIHPLASLIRDKEGNFYGTTRGGGAFNVGTVFELMADNTEIILYSFMGRPDGKQPAEGLARDAAGNLHGITHFGGSSNRGTVFELTANGVETVLHSFTGGADGGSPEDESLIWDGMGNLYGTTAGGGTQSDGTVFKVDPAGNESVLYSFRGGADGFSPYSGLVRDTAGNLYGTTLGGGRYGVGTIYKVNLEGDETTLYTFTGGADGAYPVGGVTLDSTGDIYGTADSGGDASCFAPYGCGTVFKLDTSGNFTALHIFTGGADGIEPLAGVTLDAMGNIYGTTAHGGSGPCNLSSGAPDCGIIFRVDNAGVETVLYNFSRPGGVFPSSVLIPDSDGNLYGTTREGGDANYGTVFRFTP